MRRDADTLDRLVTFLEERFKPIGLDCCVLATGVLIDILKAGGIHAEPVSVQVTVWNRAAWELHQTEPFALDDKLCLDRIDADPDAYLLALGFPANLVTQRKPDLPGGRWNGHLIAATDTYLLDPTIGQMSRPERGLTIPPLTVRLRGRFRNGGDNNALGLELNQLDQPWRIVYVAKPDNRAYRSSPDWKGPGRERVSRSFIKMIRSGACPGVSF
jgi:hypothetical protein